MGTASFLEQGSQGDAPSLFDAQFQALKSDEHEYRSSWDSDLLLDRCKSLIDMARQSEDPQRIQDALRYTIRVSFTFGEFEHMSGRATELIQGGLGAEARAHGYHARYLAKQRLAEQSSGDKRRLYLTQAVEDCGDLIMALESIQEPSAGVQDLLDSMSMHRHDREAMQADLTKRTLWQKIGALVTG